jgi:hypothetical protein
MGADDIQKNGPPIVVPKSKRRRLRKSTMTNGPQAKLLCGLAIPVQEGCTALPAAMRALDRLDCWGAAVRQLQSIPEYRWDFEMTCLI